MGNNSFHICRRNNQIAASITSIIPTDWFTVKKWLGIYNSFAAKEQTNQTEKGCAIEYSTQTTIIHTISKKPGVKEEPDNLHAHICGVLRTLLRILQADSGTNLYPLACFSVCTCAGEKRAFLLRHKCTHFFLSHASALGRIPPF
jgi:hypothetical protein